MPVFVNPAAGAGAAADAVADALAAADVAAQVRAVPPAQLADAVRDALRSGTRIIGVAGGDGSLSTAAGILAGSGSVLAPFPAGTLNHFARRLGLENIEATVAALQAGRTLHLPMGLVSAAGAGDGRHFINNAACGFYPHVVRHREQLRSWLGKWPAALVAGVRVLLGLRRLSLTLDVPEATLRRRVPALWLGLGRGSFTLPVHDEPKPEATQLEIVLPRAQTRAALVGLGLRVLKRLLQGGRPDPDDVEILHTATLRLEARHAVDIALDGEPLRLRPPLHFTILPRALEVIAPAAEPDR